MIRRTLIEHGITAGCAALRKAKGAQMRTTTTFPQRDGRTRHMRMTNAREGLRRDNYAALGVAMNADGRRKTTIREGLEIPLRGRM